MGAIIYILIFILSLAVIVLSVYVSSIEMSIVHLENGRKPEARVSLMGYVIFPVFFMGVVYLGNMLSHGLGWYLVFVLFFMVALHTGITLPKKIKKYNELLDRHTGS